MLSLAIAEGALAYQLTHAPAKGSGRSLTQSELDDAIQDPVVAIVFDKPGTAEILPLLAGLAETAFEQDLVSAVLEQNPDVEDWRVGEAIAEGYLCEHRACQFPWPDGRDERRAHSSLPGADLVGFQASTNGFRFAFGEVKTSTQKHYPPNVLSGRSGLIAQLEYLRDEANARSILIRYLAHRAVGASWRSTFEKAFQTYLKDSGDYSIFGFLVRDVDPHEDDLRTRTAALGSKCSAPTDVELISLYLPIDEIAQLGKKVAKVFAKEPN